MVEAGGGAADLLRLTEALAGVGFWRLDLADERISWSAQTFRIHGMDPSQGEPSPLAIAQTYVEEDRAEVLALFQRARETGEAFRTRARLRRSDDGELRVVVSNATVERDAQGAPAAISGVFMDVTDQERAMAQMAQNEAQFRLLAESALDVLCHYDARGVISYISPSCEAVFGYRPDELVGLTSFEFIAPESAEDVRRTFRAFFEGGPAAAPPLLEYVALRKDGSRRDMEGRPRAFWSPDGRLLGFQDVARDVTQARQAQREAAAAVVRAEQAGREVAESEARYRMIADHTTDLILRFSLRGRITYCSPAVRMWGYEPGEVEGRTMLDFIHDDDRTNHDTIVMHVLSGQPASTLSDASLRARRSDGSYIWLEGAPSIVRDADGLPVGIVSVFRDVTARKALEAELIGARDRAEAAAEAKAEFLANMSHELRTPLTAVLGFSQLAAAQPELTAETRSHLSRVSHAGKALLSTVNDILDLSKLEAGRLEIAPCAADVAELAGETLALFAADADDRGLRLASTGLDTLPAQLEVDPDRLRQVLLNLLGNAMKFTERGGVTLTARYDPAAEMLAFEVGDTGCGVPPDRLASLFQRFSQAEETISRRFGGTGLGLAICKRLVEAMGGAVTVASRLGEGSTFGFTVSAPLAARGVAAAVVVEPERMALQGARVLVIDDNPINGELIGALLAPQGAAVTLANSGETGLCLAGAAAFDVILLDLRMPGMDGFETARRLRAEAGPNRDTPTLAFSADALASLSEDLDGLVRKPLTVASLFTALGDALRPGARPGLRRRAALG